MRSIFVGIILMLACIHFGLTSLPIHGKPFKTGKLQLFSSFGGLGRQKQTFFMDEDYKEGDRVVVNLQDLKGDNALYQLEQKILSLQVKFVEGLGKVTLEVIHQQSNKSHQLNWVIVVSYIIIKKQINSEVFFIQNIKLGSFTSINHLANQMILTVSADLEVEEQKDEKYEIAVLQRGFEMNKNKDLGYQLQMNVGVNAYFVKEGHIHIQTNFIHIKTCFITLLIIDKTKLYAFSIQMAHTFNINSPTAFTLTRQLSIKKCTPTLVSNEQNLCWQTNFEKQAIQFNQVRSLSLNLPSESINMTQFYLEDQPFSLYGRNRLLSSKCFPSSCKCDSKKQPFATACYEDAKCKCKILTCATGYYTAGTLVDSCTKCPTTLTNCLTCGLQFGSPKVACTSCATGYTVVNGVCAACPVGCSSCKTVLVGTVTKVSCTACLATLVLQTSGSIKVCGCLSNQYEKVTVNPVICVNCPTGCSTCSSSTVCTSCSTGYYISGPSCLACMPVCKTCLTGTTCLTCLSSTFVSIAGVCTCPSPLFYDTTTKSCLSCTSKYPNCASCAYSTTYDPANPPSVVCATANSGYKVTSGAPAACISYCSDCNLAPGTLCTTANTNFTFNGVSCICQGGLYFSSTANTCLSCDQVVPGCSTCQTTTIPSPTQCTLCNSAGYFNPSAYPTTSCTACPFLCATCTALNACILCVNDLIVLANGTCGCNSVSLFLDPITLYCLPCSTVIFNCQTCTASGTSVTCATCLAGNYPSSTGYTCYPCPSTCSACLNSTYCTTCETGYDLVSNLCVCGTACSDCMTNSTGTCSSCTYSPSFSCLSCVTGYYSSGVSCLLCNLLWSSCTECTISTCLSCQSPFILVSSGCACNNTAGLYKSINGSTCLSCSSVIAQCSTCSNTGSTICSTCALGYYVSSSQVCSPCTGNCLTCSSSPSHCDSCLVTYSMVSPNTCDCNNTAGYFYDSSTAGCSLCSALLSNCLSCALNATNQTQCSSCASTYYWNTTTFSCGSCSTTCYECSSFSYCTSCQYNLIPVLGVCVCNSATIPAVFLDSSSGTCQQCSFIISGCTTCTDNGSAILCSGCVGSTYLVNNTCANCPASCATCNSTSCLSCPGTLTLSQGICICDTSCQQCNTLSIGCLSCLITSSVVTTCYFCSPGTYLSSPSCITCPSTCTTCTSSTNCLTCQNSYVLINGMCLCAISVGMFPNSLGVCTACSQIYYACTECDLSNGVTICGVCANGYYLSGGSCLPCDISCPTCSGSAATCTSCPTGETLTGTTCACTTANCLACSAVSAHCSSCIYTIFGNFSSCQTCMTGYYVNGVNCSPCPTVCKSCGANGACLSCATSFQVIGLTCLCDSAANMWQSGNICVTCTSLYSNCQTCIQNASVALNVTCSLCQYGYFLNNSLCVASFCSDGLITSGQTCDDKNVFDGDGCSSFCQTQTNFLCVGQPSVCKVHVNFSLTNTAIEVSKTICNRVTISFQIYPIYDSYATANFQNLFGFVSQTKLLYKSCSYSSGIVKYEFDYTDSLFDILAIFYFTPSALVIETSTLPIITVEVPLKSTNNVIMAYYDEKSCKSKEKVKALVKAVEYASYGTLLASALPCKIVGLQLFGVLQMTHINIGNMDNVNTMMTPLMGMKGVHGFTLNFGKESSNSSSSRLLQSGYTPSRVQSIGYESNFLRNCNVMLFIVIAVIIISLILYTLTYCCKTCAPSLHSISKRIIKEVLLTLILFNCYNFAYSAGIHFNYAPKYDSLYTAGTIAAVLSLILPIVMALGLMCSEDEGFGEYKEKFKPGVVERLYFVVTILYRTGIGLYISTMNQDEMSTLIVMALSISFLLYNLVNLPYAKAYHNYRANICHLTQFISLFVALYYRSMLSSTSRSTSSTIFTPVYIQLACICISLLVSMIVLTYEIYIFIKECFEKKQQKNTQTKVSSESSINNEKNVHHHLGTSEGDIQVIEENKDLYEFYES